jgi:ABC-type sulfate transport system permease component
VYGDYTDNEDMYYAVYAGAGAFGSVFVCSLLNLRLHHALATVLPYVILSPLVINLVPIYALANLDNLEVRTTIHILSNPFVLHAVNDSLFASLLAFISKVLRERVNE